MHLLISLWSYLKDEVCTFGLRMHINGVLMEFDSPQYQLICAIYI